MKVHGLILMFVYSHISVQIMQACMHLCPCMHADMPIHACMHSFTGKQVNTHRSDSGIDKSSYSITISFHVCMRDHIFISSRLQLSTKLSMVLFLHSCIHAYPCIHAHVHASIEQMQASLHGCYFSVDMRGCHKRACLQFIVNLMSV